MILGITGRTALVVGASRGIGLEIARELQVEGCRVVGVSRSDMGYPSYGRHIQQDLMREDGVKRLIEKLEQTPEIIVHVLGGSQGITGTLLPSSEWAKVWRLNVGIAHDINCAFIPAMQQNRWGRIIHISSNAPRIGTGYCPYTSAKAALNGYIMMIAKEFSRDGVIITGVAPGIVHTPGRYFASLDSSEQEAYFNSYIPAHRFGRAEEVAKVVAFLASEHAAYMAGSIVQIDGGAR